MDRKTWTWSLFIVSLLVSVWFTSDLGAQGTDPLDTLLAQNWSFASQQLTASLNAISITRYPHYTHPDTEAWVTTTNSAWTSGFFPGALWLMYQATGQSSWRTAAAARQSGIESQQTRTNTHDLGFMFVPPFLTGYRLTADSRYRQVLLTAAASLATRYRPAVGVIHTAWPASQSTEVKTIIDILMNLELLFWASKNGGQAAWYDMALNHALTARRVKKLELPCSRDVPSQPWAWSSLVPLQRPHPRPHAAAGECLA